MLKKIRNRIPKRMLALLAFVMILGVVVPIMIFANPQNRVTVNGNQVHFYNQQPIVVNDRVLVPVRGVFEHVGFDVQWDDVMRVARMTRHNQTIIIPADARGFYVNNTRIIPEVPQRIHNERLMLPLRAVAEAIGGTAYWHNNTRTAAITLPTPSPQEYARQVTEAFLRQSRFSTIFAGGGNQQGVFASDFALFDISGNNVPVVVIYHTRGANPNEAVPASMYRYINGEFRRVYYSAYRMPTHISGWDNFWTFNPAMHGLFTDGSGRLIMAHNDGRPINSHYPRTYAYVHFDNYRLMTNIFVEGRYIHDGQGWEWFNWPQLSGVRESQSWHIINTNQRRIPMTNETINRVAPMASLRTDIRNAIMGN